MRRLRLSAALWVSVYGAGFGIGAAACGNAPEETSTVIDDCEDDPFACATFYVDRDGDGFGDSSFARTLPRASPPYITSVGGDCDDTNPNVFPASLEQCNEIDDDCDGTIDEPDSVACTEFFADNDLDGFGDADDSRCRCQPSLLYTVTTGDDCDDRDALRYPGAPELGTGTDSDCDGETDEGFDGTEPECTNEPPAPKIDSDGDGFTDDVDNCPDITNQRQSDADEDEIGDACDDDVDGDGVPNANDCEPFDARFGLPEPERCGDGIDNDCDLLFDEPGAQGCTDYFPDGDGDGFGFRGHGLCLCVPYEPYVHANDGDCDAERSDVNPGAAEVCDGIDNDCDGDVDETGAIGCTDFYTDVDDDGFGTGTAECRCAPGDDFTARRGGDCDDADSDHNPATLELCDTVDNDCDGAIDEGFDGECLVLDADEDLVPDTVDNCIDFSSANQRDNDGDGIGDVCDRDDCDGGLDAQWICASDSATNVSPFDDGLYITSGGGCDVRLVQVWPSETTFNIYERFLCAVHRWFFGGPTGTLFTETPAGVQRRGAPLGFDINVLSHDCTGGSFRAAPDGELYWLCDGSLFAPGEEELAQADEFFAVTGQHLITYTADEDTETYRVHVLDRELGTPVSVFTFPGVDDEITPLPDLTQTRPNSAYLVFERTDFASQREWVVLTVDGEGEVALVARIPQPATWGAGALTVGVMSDGGVLGLVDGARLVRYDVAGERVLWDAVDSVLTIGDVTQVLYGPRVPREL